MSVRIVKHSTPDALPTRCYPLRRRFTGRLGEWLVHRGLISRADLFTALNTSFRHSCRIGDALVWLQAIDRGRLETEVSNYQRLTVRSTAVYRPAHR